MQLAARVSGKFSQIYLRNNLFSFESHWWAYLYSPYFKNLSLSAILG